jgi:large subunit ribosomal protein L3
MSGHMGVVRRTIENLRIVSVDVPRNLLLIRGALPGAAGGNVIVRASLKAARHAARKIVTPNKVAPARASAAAPAKPAAAAKAATKAPAAPKK